MVTDEHSALCRLLDKDRIVELVYRYSFYVDHRLYDEVVELFTDDCIVDYGPGWPPVRTRDALRRMFDHPGFKATSHHNANVLVTFEGDDDATVLTSVYAWHEQQDGTTPRLWGYYHDSVLRSPDGWRIAARQLRVLGVEGWHSNWHQALEGNSD